MRKWIIPLAVLMVVPALGAAAPIVVPAVNEQLVEGHTVFTVIEQYTCVGDGCTPPPTGNRTQYAAAVAVLVREKTENVVCPGVCSDAFNFPGVLWFNDQYLVNPVADDGGDDYDRSYTYRYPCTGAVLAVNDGASSPITSFDAMLVRGADIPGVLQYNESYQIMDPNDHIWIVDKWERSSDGGLTWGDYIWTVAIKNNDLFRDVDDDGVSNCEAYYEDPLQYFGEGYNSSMPGLSYLNPLADNDLCAGDTDFGGVFPYGVPRCNDETYIDTTGHATVYNAVLFFFLEDLTAAGTDKDHSVASTDVSGCASAGEGRAASGPYYTGDTEWVCPGGNDDAEGNSHPYNPCDLKPFDAVNVCPAGAGQNNHGGSGASGAQYSHATRNIDIYYDRAPIPAGLRDINLLDTQGSTAPFHCHEEDTCVGLPGYGSDSYGGGAGGY